MVLEALTNTAKPAAAERVTVTTDDERSIRVTVRDDGAGYDPAASSHGFGATGMRERPPLVDGSLSVITAPGAGTTISAELPPPSTRPPPGVGHTQRRQASGAWLPRTAPSSVGAAT